MSVAMSVVNNPNTIQNGSYGDMIAVIYEITLSDSYVQGTGETLDFSDEFREVYAVLCGDGDVTRSDPGDKYVATVDVDDTASGTLKLFTTGGGAGQPLQELGDGAYSGTDLNPIRIVVFGQPATDAS